MYQHWEPDAADIQKLKKYFATAIGPWEPYKYYDKKPTMEIMGEEWMSFHMAREEERSENDAQETEAQETNKLEITKCKSHHNKLTIQKQHGEAVSTSKMAPSEVPNEPTFMDALQDGDGDENPLLLADEKSNLKPQDCLGKAFHLAINYSTFLCKPEINQFLEQMDADKFFGYNEPFNTFAFVIQAKATIPEAEALQPYLTWQPLKAV